MYRADRSPCSSPAGVVLDMLLLFLHVLLQSIQCRRYRLGLLDVGLFSRASDYHPWLLCDVFTLVMRILVFTFLRIAALVQGGVIHAHHCLQSLEQQILLRAAPQCPLQRFSLSRYRSTAGYTVRPYTTVRLCCWTWVGFRTKFTFVEGLS